VPLGRMCEPDGVDVTDRIYIVGPLFQQGR
jgi:hypothetical protein